MKDRLERWARVGLCGLVGAAAASAPLAVFADAAGRQPVAASGPEHPAVAPLTVRLGLIEGLSGPFANAGEAVARNLVFAVERINARQVRVGQRVLRLELVPLDSRGEVDGALGALQSAIDRGIRVVLQGNSSAVAGALVEAIDKHNQRRPDAAVLFLNYSALDPVLTRERCSFWHFRFDADVEMRLAALLDAIAADRNVRRVYLLNQNYSFGQQFARLARAGLAQRRPDVEIVGDELIPIGRVKDFSPYAQKIRTTGADTVITGNWGNDLTLLVRAARESALDVRFHTFYANGLGAPAAIGSAGVGRVTAVAEWHYNAGTSKAMDALYEAFRARFPRPADDYFHARMQLMVEMFAEAAAAAAQAATSTDRRGEDTDTLDVAAVAAALEGRRIMRDGITMTMRADDHQVQTDLFVSLMDAAGAPGVARDIEGSGFGFRTLAHVPASAVATPPACAMTRPKPVAK